MAILAAASGFGAVSVLAKLAYDAGSEPESLLVTRLVVGGLLLSLAALPALPHRRAPVRARLSLLGALAGGGLAVGGLLEFEGLARLPAPFVVLLLFASPVWVGLASWLLWGRPLGRRRAASMLVVAGGMALLAGPSASGGPDTIGILLAVLASLVYAGVYLIMEHLVATLDPPIAIGIIGVSAGVTAVCLDPWALTYELADSGTARYALAIGLLTGLCLRLLASGLVHTPAFTASVISGVQPTVAGVLSWLTLGEVLTAVQTVGGLVVLAGAVWTSLVDGAGPTSNPAT